VKDRKKDLVKTKELWNGKEAMLMEVGVMQMRSWTLKKMVKYLGEGRKAASEKEEKKKEERKKKRRTERREGHTVLKRTVLKEGGKKRNFLAGKRNFWREKFCSLFSETCSLFGKKKGKKKEKKKKKSFFLLLHTATPTPHLATLIFLVSSSLLFKPSETK